MTHIFILVDPETITLKKSNQNPKEIVKQIYNGDYKLPPEMRYPYCFNIDDYVFVIGQKPMPKISKIQEEILEKLACNASMRQIADVMGYSYDNIRYHVDELKRKFNVSTRAELANIYIRYNPHLF